MILGMILGNWMDSRVQKAHIQISAVCVSWDPLSLFSLDLKFSCHWMLLDSVRAVIWISALLCDNFFLVGLNFSVHLCCLSDGFVAATLDFSFLIAIIFAIPED